MTKTFLLLLLFISSTMFTQSEGELRKILQKNPNDIPTYAKLIELSTTREQVMKNGNDALAQVGARSAIYTAMGNTYMKIRDYNSAVSSYRNAVNLNPRSATAYNRLGLALLRINYFHQAEVAFKTAIAFTAPNTVTSLQYQTHLAITFENQKDLVRAKQTIDTILKINPSFTAALEVQKRL